MPRGFGWFVLLPTMVMIVSSALAADELGIEAPDGFHVSLYADDDLAHNIYSMTVDARGRVVVCGPGYIKVLHDDDGDGRADRATRYSEKPASGAHGICFDGPRLLCTGDNALMLLEDRDGDDRADGPPQVWTQLRNPEHGANGIVKGPDGWFYLICGNDAGVSKEHVKTNTSPVKDPRCGAVVRFSPDGKLSEVVAHGFRNPYDLDFNAYGQLFTVDADGERDHNLPWYAPTRLFDIAQGMEHGWLLQGWQRSWNRPQSFYDNVERMVEIGRGSPTGLVVYRHRQFPEAYRGSVLSACWSFGRVYRLPLERKGSTYQSHAEVFLQTKGELGFAPVDLAVGPAGELYVAIGGRGTRGGVFRVTYGDGSPPKPISDDPLQRVLAADQPLASWSRAKWEPVARKLRAKPFEQVATDGSRPTFERIRAIEVLCELFDGVSLEVARSLQFSDPEVTARVAWCVARQRVKDNTFTVFVADLTAHGSPIVLRQAWESLATSQAIPTDINWGRAMVSGDRRVRAAMHTAMESRPRFWSTYRPNPVNDLRSTVAWNRYKVSDEPGREERDRFLLSLDQLWRELKPLLLATDDRLGWLDAIRLIQIHLGDLRVQPGQAEVYSGYSGNAVDSVPQQARDEIVSTLASKFPMPDAEVNRELGRLFSMLSAEHAELPARVAGQWTSQSTPQDDIHWLIILSRLPGTRSREVTQATADALAGLHGKMRAGQLYPSRNWPLRVGEAFENLCRLDATLPAALVAHPDFGHYEHSLFAALMKGPQQQAAAAKLLARAEAAGEEENAWTSELISVLGALPDEQSLPILRERYSDVSVRDAIVPLLARNPVEQDRARFIEALGSMQSEVVAAAAEALTSLSPSATPGEITAAVRALKAQCAVKQQLPARKALARLLERWSGRRFAIKESEDLLASYRPWFDWFASAHPEAAASMVGLVGSDAAAWKDRLAGVDWSQSDATRGRLVFEKKACHRCHQGGGKLGPDLAGAAGRFSRDDLFAAIIDPSKEISPLYKTTLIATRSGKVYHGLMVYESPEGTLLQTTPDTTLRITGEELLTMQPSRQSLMPTGLLNELTNRDLADLYAYLKTIKPR